MSSAAAAQGYSSSAAAYGGGIGGAGGVGGGIGGGGAVNNGLGVGAGGSLAPPPAFSTPSMASYSAGASHSTMPMSGLNLSTNPMVGAMA